MIQATLPPASSDFPSFPSCTWECQCLRSSASSDFRLGLRPFPFQTSVQRTLHSDARLVEDVCIDHPRKSLLAPHGAWLTRLRESDFPSSSDEAGFSGSVCHHHFSNTFLDLEHQSVPDKLRNRSVSKD